MKTVFAFFVLFAASASAFAAEVTLETQDLDVLPEVTVVGVQTSDVGGLATVEPTLTLVYKYTSCSSKLKMEKRELDGVILVSLSVDPTSRECRGPRTSRTYREQLTSMDRGQRVVVLNPVPTIR